MNKLLVAIALSTLLVAVRDGAAPTTDLTVVPSINPELAAHSRHFTPRVHKVGDFIYSAARFMNLFDAVIQPIELTVR